MNNKRSSLVFFVLIVIAATTIIIVLYLTDILYKPPSGIMATVIGAIISAVVPTFSVLWVSAFSKQALVTRNLAILQYGELEKKGLNEHYTKLNSDVISSIAIMNLSFRQSPFGIAFEEIHYSLGIFENKITQEMAIRHIAHSNPQFEGTYKRLQDLIQTHNDELEALYVERTRLIEEFVGTPSRNFGRVVETWDTQPGEVHLGGACQVIDTLWNSSLTKLVSAGLGVDQLSKQVLVEGKFNNLGADRDFGKVGNNGQEYGRLSPKLSLDDFRELIIYSGTQLLEIDKIKAIFRIREQAKNLVSDIQGMAKNVRDLIGSGTYWVELKCCNEAVKQSGQ